jgi:hypothetical protein
MKLVQITVHFEYTEIVEEMLDRHGIDHYVRYPMMEGKDRDGKHFGSQVFPGNVTIFQAQTPDDTVEPLLGELRVFRDERRAHHHLQAIVLPIERVL